MKNVSLFTAYAMSQSELKDVTGGLSFAPLQPIPANAPANAAARLTLLADRYSFWANRAASFWTGIPGEPTDPRFTAAMARVGDIRQRYDAIIARVAAK